MSSKPVKKAAKSKKAGSASNANASTAAAAPSTSVAPQAESSNGNSKSHSKKNSGASAELKLAANQHTNYNTMNHHDEDDAELRQPLTHNESSHGHSHAASSHGHAHSNGGQSSHGHSHNDSSHSHAHSSHSHNDSHAVTIVDPSNASSFQQQQQTSRNSSGRSSPGNGNNQVACGGLSSAASALKGSSANAQARRKLWIASGLCMTFMICEVIGGFMANSLAVMTDAAHLLSDLAGFLISIFALWLAQRAPTSRLSFGFHRAEILGALISVILIWLLTGVLVYEAAYRIQHPEDVNGKLMFIVAAIGLCVNFAMGAVLHQAGVPHSHGLPGSDHGQCDGIGRRV